jgi:hypothetical protein
LELVKAKILLASAMANDKKSAEKGEKRWCFHTSTLSMSSVLINVNNRTHINILKIVVK